MSSFNANVEISPKLTNNSFLTWLTTNGATWIAAYVSDKPFTLSWEQLKQVDAQLAHSLCYGGIGGDRTPTAWLNHPNLLDARGASVYSHNIPDSIKALGPDAIREFKQGKHWSHQISYSKGRDMGMSREALADANNGIFESASDNLKRGADNMPLGWGTENNPGKVQIQLFNELEALKMVCDAVAINALKGFTAGFLYELVLSTFELGLAVSRQEVSVSIAVDTILKQAAMVGLKAGVVSALITGLCVYLPGAGIILTTIAPMLAAMATVVTLHRLYDILVKHLQIIGYPLPVDFVSVIYQSARVGIQEGIKHIEKNPWDLLGSSSASSKASAAEYQALQSELDDLLG